MVERICVYRVWGERPEGKTPMGCRRRRWDDNIKMDLTDQRGELDSIGSGESPVAGFFEHGNELRVS
jgi:hypothetical protein